MGCLCYGHKPSKNTYFTKHILWIYGARTSPGRQKDTVRQMYENKGFKQLHTCVYILWSLLYGTLLINERIVQHETHDCIIWS